MTFIATERKRHIDNLICEQPSLIMETAEVVDGGVSEGLEDDTDGYSSTESVDSAEKHPYSRKSKYA